MTTQERGLPLRTGGSPERVPLRAALGATALACAAVVTATLAAHGTGAEGLRLTARYTARFAFPLFALAFAASSLHALWPGAGTRALLRNRRALGVAYGLAQMVHLVAVLAVVQAGVRTLTPDPFTAAGALGFVFAAVMAATSNDASVRRLGPRAWKRLHRVGIFYIWGIYAFSYGGNVAEHPGSPAALAGLAVVGGVMALRVAAARRAR